MKERLITPEQIAALASEQTTAHRLWTGPGGWVERFGDDWLVSASGDATAIAAALPAKLPGLVPGRIFARRLVKQPGGDDRPVLVSGPQRDTRAVVLERGLKFGVDFAAGYSVGLFCDQRANRTFLESLKPARVLNCFAYTCAFSVAAARAGAETVSLDLSRRSLGRGRENFALNGLDASGHRFLADDVFAVLPRLARRGEKFDAIILDPPTFSRGGRGTVFRVERDMEHLLRLAFAVAAPGAKVLLSTNAGFMDVRALRRIGRSAGLAAREVPPPPEYPPGAASSTVWLG